MSGEGTGRHRSILVLGAVTGFLAVAFGAFAAHGLSGRISPGLLDAFKTGVDYQGLHALALLFCGLAARENPDRLLQLAAWAFLLGILLFSGSLYILALTDIRWLGMVTPLGGLAFLAGWGLLAWSYTRPRD